MREGFELDFLPVLDLLGDPTASFAEEGSKVIHLRLEGGIVGRIVRLEGNLSSEDVPTNKIFFGRRKEDFVHTVNFLKSRFQKGFSDLFPACFEQGLELGIIKKVLRPGFSDVVILGKADPGIVILIVLGEVTKPRSKSQTGPKVIFSPGFFTK